MGFCKLLGYILIAVIAILAYFQMQCWQEDQEKANIDAAYPADHFTSFIASTFNDEIVPRELIVYYDAWKADESY